MSERMRIEDRMMALAKAVEPEAPDLLLATSGEALLSQAAEYIDALRAQRDELASALDAFMRKVTWNENDEPGYPLDTEMGDILRQFRAALARARGEGGTT